MSTKTIYRCDLCGYETFDSKGWRFSVKVDRTNFNGGHDVYETGDYCPECQERVKEAFDSAWATLKAGAERG